MSIFLRRFTWILAATGVLLVVGTVGFLQFPGWSLSDALYMAVITISAVGYEEVHRLTDAGRALATGLLAGGITMMGLWFAVLTASLVELDLAHTLRKRSTMKKIGELHDHFIVCGAGRMGRQVIRELAGARQSYIVIERDHERVEKLRAADPDVLVLEDDATRDESLVQARIGLARGLAACLKEDTDNLFVCLSARDLQPGLTIVARAYDERTLQKLYTAGADHVVSPNLTGGSRMAAQLLRPQVVSFLDVAATGEGLDLRLEEVRLSEDSPLVGLSLAEARIPDRAGLIVIAARHLGERGEPGPWTYNPGPGERIRPGDVLIVLGNKKQIETLHQA